MEIVIKTMEIVTIIYTLGTEKVCTYFFWQKLCKRHASDTVPLYGRKEK